MIHYEAERARKTISVKWWRKQRNFRSSGLIKRKFGQQKYCIFVLDVSLGLMYFFHNLQLLKRGIFSFVWKLKTLPRSVTTNLLFTGWHLSTPEMRFFSVWLGKSLWVTSREGHCLKLRDSPHRRDPQSSMHQTQGWRSILTNREVMVHVFRGWVCSLNAS